ncbi:ABC transporter permease [Pannus brasiliensis CCIBt3594]|uniref:ABC transporter permease n=1 Tax=Pannus brasiliensis CCIBt3594 TaxID=1427578 RepID=A0AAW9QNS2_9CHRO
MLKYFFQRLLFAIPTLIAISIIIFGILAIAPGDPMGEFAANPSITEEVRENIRRSLGLEQPIPVRYVKWFFAFITGDMGFSFTSRSPVFDLILQRLPTTLWIVGTAYLFGILLAIPLGVISAIKRYSWIDRALTTFSLLGFSLPTFVTGLLFIIVFSVQLNWFPSFYSSTLKITDLETFIEQIKQSILPVTVLTLYQSAMLMRFTRSSVSEEIHQEYVKTARAKGLPELKVIKNHIVRNALIPIVTLIALDIPSIFTGALVTEQVFRVPGIGSLLVDSISRSDTPVIMAITFIYAILIVIFNLIADLTYGFLDPRVRY